MNNDKVYANLDITREGECEGFQLRFYVMQRGHWDQLSESSKALYLIRCLRTAGIEVDAEEEGE